MAISFGYTSSTPRLNHQQCPPIFARRHGSLDAPEEITLDLNELAKGERFMARGDAEVSDDGNLLAYTLDNTGFREYTLHFKDLRSGRVFPESVPRVSSIAWAADNKTLFYVVDNDAKRPYRLYRHALGTPASSDSLVYEEKDAMFTLGVCEISTIDHMPGEGNSTRPTLRKLEPLPENSVSNTCFSPR